MANLTNCAICGAEYSYCPSCAGSRAWRFYTDTHEHYQIFTTLKQYSSGVFNKEDACKALINLGITVDSDLSEFKPKVAEKIKRIIIVEDKSDEDKTVIKKTRKSKLYKDED